MGLKRCLIIFDNPMGTYYAGQTVSGRVELELDAPKKVRAVRIQFKGGAETSWTETVNETDSQGKHHTKTVHHGASEEYFLVQYNLADDASGSLELHTGQHMYTFTCALPPGLPSSFEGTYGHVRYTTKVTLDRPWKFDHESKAAMTVLSPLDLNVVARCREPATVTVEKYFCCCWCRSGPLTCSIALPCTGYVPGQRIPITLELDNLSNVEVNFVHVTIVKIVTFHSTLRSTIKRSTDTVVQHRFSGVEPRSSGSWCEALNIPALPPSNLLNCSIIDVDYELQAEVSVSGMHCNVTGRIPLTIGTVPLATVPTMNMYPSAPPGMLTDMPPSVPPSMPPMVPPTFSKDSSEFSSQNTAANAPLLGWTTSPEAPPPTYEQSQFGTKSIQDSSDSQYTMYSGGSAQFSPMYPVYRPA